MNTISNLRLCVQAIITPEFQAGLAKLGAIPTLTLKERYALARSLRSIKREAETFKHVADGILKAHGLPQRDGSYEIPVERMVSFNSQRRELLQHEVELPLPEPILLSGESPLTALELAAVFELVEVSDDETTGQGATRQDGRLCRG